MLLMSVSFKNSALNIFLVEAMEVAVRWSWPPLGISWLLVWERFLNHEASRRDKAVSEESLVFIARERIGLQLCPDCSCAS